MKLSACDHGAMSAEIGQIHFVKKNGCWDLLVTEISGKGTDEQLRDPGSRLDCLWLTCGGGGDSELPSLSLGLPTCAGPKAFSFSTEYLGKASVIK